MASSLDKFELELQQGEKFESWLREKVMVDEWGRPPGLSDVPLTIMVRQEAFKKQNIVSKEEMFKLYKKMKGESDD